MNGPKMRILAGDTEKMKRHVHHIGAGGIVETHILRPAIRWTASVDCADRLPCRLIDTRIFLKVY